MDSIYGFKLGQSQEFDENGIRVPVSLVSVEPNLVVGQTTKEKNGYFSLRVAVGTKKHPNKSILGLLKNFTEKFSPRYIREIRTEDTKTVGEKITVADIFNPGDKVKVTGINKGKGFQGVVRRHGFKGGPKTHGQSDRQRHPGSIGSTTTPGRVYKGKRMAGHMGADKITVTNLSVFAVHPEQNLILVRGLIPGAKGGLVKITKT